jgi:leucyl/phenylalanyl-tRNA--protein transferase
MKLDIATILNAYAQGAFPMADHSGRLGWFTANPRCVLPLDTFHTPRSVRQLIARNAFEIRINCAFEGVMRECMLARDTSWITEELVAAYVNLHRAGHAHSVEAWREGRLAGGLYGVTLGAAFFGESMFHTEANASKVALVALVQRLRDRGYELLDSQTVSHHLLKFGAIEIPEQEYMRRLKRTLGRECTFV